MGSSVFVIALSQGKCPLDVPSAFHQMPPYLPEPPQAPGESVGDGDILMVYRMVDRSAQVVVISRQATQPVQLSGGENLTVRHFCKVEKDLGVTVLNLGFDPPGNQGGIAVLADHGQHPIAWGAGAFDLMNQAALDKLGHPVEDIEPVVIIPANGFNMIECEGAGEN
jgi:hypothetical protein